MTRIKAQTVEAEARTLPLHTKYRPNRLEDIRGQAAVIKSLKSALSATARPHVYLFTGPAGTGKTSLARILCKEFHVLDANLLEIDAATNNGIDVMRDVLAPLRYHGFGTSPNKAVILDEAHMLTKQAWASLLKTIEEPPDHVFFFFCTTEAGKVPQNILTRCHAYNLHTVKFDDICELLDEVCEAERFTVSNDVLSLVASSSGGSPRQALVMLSMVHSIKSVDEAARVLEAPLDNGEVIELCKLMLSGQLTWPSLQSTLKDLGDMPAESIRIVCTCYFAACLMSSKNEKQTVRLLEILECFAKPCNPTDKLAPILLAFGRYIYP